MFIGNLTAEEAMEEMRNGSYRAGRDEERREMIAKLIEVGKLTAAEALELFGVQVDETALGKSE